MCFPCEVFEFVFHQRRQKRILEMRERFQLVSQLFSRYNLFAQSLRKRSYSGEKFQQRIHRIHLRGIVHSVEDRFLRY